MTDVMRHDSLDLSEWTTAPPVWLGDGRAFEVPGTCWGAAGVELVGAPAREDGVNAVEAASRLFDVSASIARGLRGWENQGCLEFRYAWDPHGAPGRLRMMVIGRAVGRRVEAARAWAGQMVDNAVALFPPGYEFGPLTDPMPAAAAAWAEIERVEETRQPGATATAGGVGYYYLIHPMGGSGGGWHRLAPALTRLTAPGFLSVVLVPTSMTDLEREAIDHVCTQASYLAAPQQSYDYFGNQVTTPADSAAGALLESWQRFSGRNGLLCRIGVAAEPHEIDRVASLVGAVVTDGSGTSTGAPGTRFKIVRDIGDFEAWKTVTLGLPFPRRSHPVWSLPDDQTPVTLERMPYFFAVDEVAGLAVLPVPDEQGVPGVALSRSVSGRRAVVRDSPAVAGVALGQQLHLGREHGEAVLPLTAVNRHALVVGSPGSGKTTSVMSMIVRLWRDHRIPTLVIESVKHEYRGLLGVSGMAETQVITLGNEEVSPLRINPLEPPPGVRCEIHQGAVLASLKMALPLFPPQPQILVKALTRAYETAGWDDDTTVEDGIDPPTLRHLLACYRQVFEQIGYRGEAQNVGLGFAVRLESLLMGSRGKLLDTVRSTDFGALLSVPTVVELDDVHDADDKSMLATFVLERVRAAARGRGSSGGVLRHVTVIEEAHRLLGKQNVGAGDAVSGDRTRADAVTAFCEAIAELRSAGEGFVLSTQSPSALADAAVTNSGCRVVHRLEAAKDRAFMLDDMGSSEAVRDAAARLRQGEAVVRWPELDEPELIRVTCADGVDSGRPVADAQVAERMTDLADQVRRQLPFALCTTDACAQGCSVTVRRRGASLARSVAVEVSDVYGQDASVRDFGGAVRVVAAAANGEAQLGQCVAVHLERDGVAFVRNPGVRFGGPDLARLVKKACRHASG